MTQSLETFTLAVVIAVQSSIGRKKTYQMKLKSGKSLVKMAKWSAYIGFKYCQNLHPC